MQSTFQSGVGKTVNKRSKQHVQDDNVITRREKNKVGKLTGVEARGLQY